MENQICLFAVASLKEAFEQKFKLMIEVLE